MSRTALKDFSLNIPFAGRLAKAEPLGVGALLKTDLGAVADDAAASLSFSDLSNSENDFFSPLAADPNPPDPVKLLNALGTEDAEPIGANADFTVGVPKADFPNGEGLPNADSGFDGLAGEPNAE